ncbi:hypothetical protein [Cognatilysobacter bugurensis]|uniref:Uncharacterized protein n=1 Tax=Cognatilysobacter bugurensis TaxID=543356 RepID=A0A918W665_9GAMM|nr:hypothetical protein [Lysobacter bugurensis]GHA72833.1 hypothetical protein GCM10007067_06790 [Lysobacter bugurensis]
MTFDAADAALVIGALALYLYDSAMLLYADEIVLTRGRRGWCVSSGSGYTLDRRFPVLGQPWAPWRPQFRERWDRTAVAEAPRDDAAFYSALRPLQWASALQFVWLFAALPAVLFLRAPIETLLVLAIAVYATSGAAVAFAVGQRDRLGLTKRALLTFATDVLACPPFAINAARKACLARGLQTEVQAFLASHLRPEERVQVARVIRTRLHGGGEAAAASQSEPGPQP